MRNTNRQQIFLNIFLAWLFLYKTNRNTNRKKKTVAMKRYKNVIFFLFRITVKIL